MHTPSNEAPDPGTLPEAAPDGIEIRQLTDADEMHVVGEVFQQVWGSSTDLVRHEMLVAIAHAGGYVVGAFDTTRSSHDGRPGEIVGASVALLANHEGRPALHSHVTGILPGARSGGLGRTMKMHQRAWAVERDIEWIVWTFDPLVRRNAWFNIALLGADVHEYLPDFYGTMTDVINAGDVSDRLLMAWSTAGDVPAADAHGAVRDGSDVTDPLLIPTPEDIVTLRRTDPVAVARWRADTRTALTEALDAGHSVVGFTRDGNYVVRR